MSVLYRNLLLVSAAKDINIFLLIETYIFFASGQVKYTLFRGKVYLSTSKWTIIQGYI